MFVKPGYLSKQLKGYERQRQINIEQNILELEAAGIQNPSKFFFFSNQSANDKCTDNRTNKSGHGDGDEAYVPSNDEERLGADSDNDGSLRFEANKVISKDPRKNDGCSNAQVLRKSRRIENGSSPQNATATGQCPTSPIDVGSIATPEIPSSLSQNHKRTRGPTKLKRIALDEGSRVKVEFDEYGQPIGEGSVKLSSFLGPLVREIMPFTLTDWRKLPSGMAEVLWQSIQVRFHLDEEWHRDMVFQKMNEDWRASKSRLVKKIRDASNDEERLKLQPDNIKSLHDWKDFIKEKTSASFKVKSNHFKEMRNRQLPLTHTMSRKGYARLTAEMKGKSEEPSSITRTTVWANGHRKKNGQPINKNVEQKIEDMEKVEHNTPSSNNLNEDALCKVLGPEKRGRLRTFGKGVTKTKLNVLSQMSGHISQMHEENMQLKFQMIQMQNSIDELKKIPSS